MAYEPTLWTEPGPPWLSAENLNKLEQGVKGAHDGLAAIDLTAAKIAFTAAGGILATNVQAALEELDSEKAASSAAVPAAGTTNHYLRKDAQGHSFAALTPASESTEGVTRQATEAQVQAGTAGNLFATVARLKAELDRRIAPTAWTDIPPSGTGWTSFDANTVPRYSRIGEIVFVEGVVKKTSPTAFETILTLPVGTRPGKIIAEPVNASNAFGLMQVLDTGEMRYVSGNAATTFYTFISFRRA